MFPLLGLLQGAVVRAATTLLLLPVIDTASMAEVIPGRVCRGEQGEARTGNSAPKSWTSWRATSSSETNGSKPGVKNTFRLFTANLNLDIFTDIYIYLLRVLGWYILGILEPPIEHRLLVILAGEIIFRF